MSMPKFIKEVFDNAECLYTKNQVEAALDQMAIAIRAELEDKNPIILCVMVGGVIPTAALLSRLDFPLELDYVHATRYEQEFVGSSVTWKKQASCDMTDRTVLIIDDILDGGITLQAIIDDCKKRRAKEIFTAALLDKDVPREPGGVQTVDFAGIKVENRWLFGYGLDYKEYLRNAPGIYAAAPEHSK